jgi:general secretion pathway protein L
MMALKLTGPQPASGGFIRWWLDELGSVLPRRLAPARAPRQGFLLRRRGEALEVLRQRGRGAAPLGLLELPPPLPATTDEDMLRPPALSPAARGLVDTLAQRRVPAVLLLEPGDGLLCADTLPAGAEAEVERIMPHRVDLLTPWPQDRVLAGYRVTGRTKDGQLEIRLGVAPKARVEPVLSRLAAYGVTLDAVDLPGEDGEPSGLNLLGTKPARGGRRWRVLGFLLLAALLVGGAAASVDAYEAYQQLAAQQRFAEALEQRLADLSQLTGDVDTLRKTATFIPEQQRATPSPTVVMEVLSRLLPDSVWLDAVTLDGREVTLSGYAEDAAQVLPIIESSPHFKEAQFRAPSTRVTVPGPGGGTREVERFSLSAKVEPMAEPQP